MAESKTRIRRTFTSENKLRAVQLVTEKGFSDPEATFSMSRSLFEYFEMFYNRIRRYSSPGSVPPAEFEGSEHP